MMFISKMIYDPAVSYPNLRGRTVGLVFYTPKFWDCHKYNFYSNQFDEMRDGELDEEEMEHRYLTKQAHQNCKRKHMSYLGYMYWVGLKNRYVFNYMWWHRRAHGSERRPFHKRRDRATYIRWFNNGPKPPPRPEPKYSDDDIRDAFAVHNERFRQSLAKAEATMIEYERIRERR